MKSISKENLSGNKKDAKHKFSSKKHLIVFVVLLSIVSFVFAQTTAYKIYIIGDSTVCNYGAR